MMVLRRSAT